MDAKTPKKSLSSFQAKNASGQNSPRTLRVTRGSLALSSERSLLHNPAKTTGDIAHVVQCRAHRIDFASDGASPYLARRGLHPSALLGLHGS